MLTKGSVPLNATLIKHIRQRDMYRVLIRGVSVVATADCVLLSGGRELPERSTRKLESRVLLFQAVNLKSFLEVTRRNADSCGPCHKERSLVSRVDSIVTSESFFCRSSSGRILRTSSLDLLDPILRIFDKIQTTSDCEFRARTQQL